MKIEFINHPLELSLEPFEEVNFRSNSEADSYPKFWVSDGVGIQPEAWINGILYFKSWYGGEWIKVLLQPHFFNMKLVRLARRQDITVP